MNAEKFIRIVVNFKYADSNYIHILYFLPKNICKNCLYSLRTLKGNLHFFPSFKCLKCYKLHSYIYSRQKYYCNSLKRYLLFPLTISKQSNGTKDISDIFFFGNVNPTTLGMLLMVLNVFQQYPWRFYLENQKYI